MIASMLRWSPLALLSVGALFTVGIDRQRSMPLRQPLATSIPIEIDGYHGRDVEIAENVARVAAANEYLMRVYENPDSSVPWFSVYVGYYESQAQGKTIHSPKNCLPGAGWEAINSTTQEVALPHGGTVTVNRYVLQREDERALVLYWYQGRGRVAANEYRVKWDLLRDSAVSGRSDEALARIVVPIVDSQEAAKRRAIETATLLVPRLEATLPP